MAAMRLPTGEGLNLMTNPIASERTLKALGDLAADAGIRRVHMLAWRDLDDPEAGGSEVHADHIASLWAQAGIEVVHRTSYAAGKPTRTRRHGYEVVRKAGRYLVFPRSVVAELAGRNGHRDGLVEIWNGMPFMSPMWCRGPRSVWLHHVHGPMWAMTLPRNLAKAGVLLEERLAPPFYRRTSIVTLSESSKHELVHALGFQADRVTVVEPGIDPKFTPGGRRSETPLVVAVGRLVPVKDVPRLVRIFAQVRHRVPAARLVVVGDGYERDRIDAEIQRCGVDGSVEMVGRIDDEQLIDLYRQAWTVSSMSVREGWGMTLTEAAACGTPAVATNIAGHADAAPHDRSALLGDHDDELVDAMTAMLTDTALRERLQRGALARAAELTWESAAIGTFRSLASDAVARRTGLASS